MLQLGWQQIETNLSMMMMMGVIFELEDEMNILNEKTM